MDARQKAIVKALNRVRTVIERHSLDGYAMSTSIADAATLRALAAAIEGGQEMWQHRNDPQAMIDFDSDEDPAAWRSNYRRVLVIELPE